MLSKGVGHYSFEFWKCSKTSLNITRIDVTILSAQCHPTVPEGVSFFIPPGRARSFIIVCLCLPLPLMVSCTLMFQVLTTSRFHSSSLLSSCIHMLAGCVTKTRTSIYEVSLPLGETVGNKVLPLKLYSC